MSTVSTKSVPAIVAEIDAYIRRHGGPYSAWYCGVAADPRSRLFIAHNVQEHGGLWIYSDAGTDANARTVECHFHSLGCKGSGGGGDRLTRYVYAYRITGTTRE